MESATFWETYSNGGTEMSRKYLCIALGITGFLFFLCAISDALLNTHYLGITTFQPFPHIFLFAGIILILYFWYKLREERRKSQPFSSKRGLLDYVILFYLCGFAGGTIALTIEFLFALL